MNYVLLPVQKSTRIVLIWIHFTIATTIEGDYKCPVTYHPGIAPWQTSGTSATSPSLTRRSPRTTIQPSCKTISASKDLSFSWNGSTSSQKPRLFVLQHSSEEVPPNQNEVCSTSSHCAHRQIFDLCLNYHKFWGIQHISRWWQLDSKRLRCQGQFRSYKRPISSVCNTIPWHPISCQAYLGVSTEYHTAFV